MQKILFITPTFGGGGAEKNLLNIINSLDDNDFQIVLVICGGKRGYAEMLQKEIDVKYLDKDSVSAAYFDLFKILRKEQPRVVFTTASQLTIPIAFFKRFLFLDYVFIARVPTNPRYQFTKSIKSSISRFLSKYGYRQASYVIGQTEEMSKEVVNVFKVNHERSITIHNLINTKQIHQRAAISQKLFKKDRFNILAIGTLYPVKGFDLLLEAFPLVRKEIPQAFITIIGGVKKTQKDYQQKLKKLTKELAVENDVEFKGFQSNPYPFLKHADLFVLCSRKEGFPNVVLEALTLDTIVVATDCVNFDGIIQEGINGVVVQKNNVKALAEGIIRAKNMTELENPQFKYSNFDYNEWFKKIGE